MADDVSVAWWGVGNAGDDARVLRRHPLNGEKVSPVEVDTRAGAWTSAV